jgi:hypothetical protein
MLRYGYKTIKPENLCVITTRELTLREKVTAFIYRLWGELDEFFICFRLGFYVVLGIYAAHYLLRGVL